LSLRTWWMFFQRCVMRTTLDIYVLFIYFLLM
jgi:hypothetical protein